MLTVLFASGAWAQQRGNARQRYIQVTIDSLIIDTLSIVPGSVSFFYPDGSVLPQPGSWKLDEAAAILKFPDAKDSLTGDSILMVYRVFPILLTKTYRNKDRSVIEKNYSGLYNPF